MGGEKIVIVQFESLNHEIRIRESGCHEIALVVLGEHERAFPLMDEIIFIICQEKVLSEHITQ